MKNNTNRLVMSMLGILCFACSPNNLGENGYVTFSDETRGPGFNLSLGVTKPVAQGATLRVRVSESNVERVHVKVNQPDVLSITSVDNIEDASQSRITVRANAVGESKLEVILSDERTDHINVAVEAVESTDIEIFPWDSLIPLDPDLWSQGVSALPNTNLTMFGQMKSASGQKLTGFHALQWHVETAGDASIEPAESSDFAIFNSGTTPGDNTLNFGNFMPLNLPTIEATQVSRLTMITPFQAPTITSGAIIILHAVFFTEDGRYVVGIDDEDVTFETSENGVIGQLMTDAQDDNNESLNLERAYRFGRATDFRASTPGTYTVTAQWKGLEAELLIHVTQSQTNETQTQAAQ